MKGSANLQYVVQIGNQKVTLEGRYKSIFDEYLSENPLDWNGWRVKRVVDVINCDLKIVNELSKEIDGKAGLIKLSVELECLLEVLLNIQNANQTHVKVYTQMSDPWKEGKTNADK